MNCRHCGEPLKHTFLDLGFAPPSNAYLSEAELCAPEIYFPLKLNVCGRCWLVQTEDYHAPDRLFDADYAYFSSCSSSWLAHAERYVERMVDRFSLDERSRVVEVAANDGYLLQYVSKLGIACLGIEPTASTARAARDNGLEIRELFFGEKVARKLAREGWSADLMVANNVLAHVPNINDFLKGFSALLKPKGVVTFEFPHLLRMITEQQFDTIYHEHYSYLSLTTVQSLCAHNGLHIFDVEELPTHGGSLRVYAQLVGGVRDASEAVVELLVREEQLGIKTAAFYSTLAPAAERIKHELLRFLLQAKAEGKKVVGYGAAAKGNTLLNYAGVRSDLLAWVADASPHKQGKFLPGSRIPIVEPTRVVAEQPDFILLLPWNLKDEVVAQLKPINHWGGRLVISVPQLDIFSI